MSDENEILEDPALKNFNETTYAAKHVAGKTLKWGAIGTVVGGAALGTVALAVGVLSPAGLVAGGLLAAGDWLGVAAVESLGVSGGIVGALESAAAVGAIGGGALSATTGFVSGVMNSDEAVDARKEDIVAQAERMEVRKEKASALEMQKIQQEANLQVQAEQMGVTPTPGLPPQAPNGPAIGG